MDDVNELDLEKMRPDQRWALLDSNLKPAVKEVMKYSVPVIAILTVLLDTPLMLIPLIWAGAIWLWQFGSGNVWGDEELRFFITSINPGFLMGMGLLLIVFPPSMLLAIVGAIIFILGALPFSIYPRIVMEMRRVQVELLLSQVRGRIRR